MKGVITHRENDGKLVFANVMSFDLYDEVRSMAEHAHETLRVGLGTLEPYIRYRHLLKCDGKEVRSLQLLIKIAIFPGSRCHR